ncbi:MAG: peptide ABC transporter substrate-binding protein [Deltaproteobacteria bacterium RBG_13_52_11b]|nr:MAG: peptide ABC transporter substrate-binding protein [Deltaproteobacteria bacterium RBG_13_52_11b]
MAENGFLLQVRALKKYFFRGRMFSVDKKPIRAVDGISFSIRQGETLGLVGESGCGKTTAGKSVLRLIEPTSGQILFKDQDILQLDREAMRRVRPHMQFIFQDPYESLNPRMKVGEIVGEGLEVHRLARGIEKTRRVSEILEQVGLHPQDTQRYPHEFSGGQRQRIGIARAVSLHPELIIADEPVSALDVSIQAQILNLLMDLRDQFGLTYLFISHDLRIVKHISDRIAVMYMGKIVEMANGEDLFLRPLHPYTQLLLTAIPKLDPRKRAEAAPLAQEGRFHPPDQGCLFQPRCPHSKETCQSEDPTLFDEGKDHWVACHFVR